MAQPVTQLDRRRMASPQVVRHLRRAILVGALRPGQRISENEIARELGVSRTPVREAFIRLSGEGLLTVYPQTGTVVAPISLAAVADSQFLRETLECRTIALAAAQCTPADAEALGAFLATQRRSCAAHDHRAFVEADDAMHRFLVDLSGRRTVWKVVQDAKAQLDRVRYLSLEDRDWLDKIFAEHEVIVDRVIGRDPAGAEAAMRAHLRTVFQAIDRIAAKHGDFFASGAAGSAGPDNQESPQEEAS